MNPNYRSKPKDVTAIQYHGLTPDLVTFLIGDRFYVNEKGQVALANMDNEDGSENWVPLSHGDWLIRDDGLKLRRCGNVYFEQNYQPLRRSVA